jgi:hypothetical protein
MRDYRNNFSLDKRQRIFKNNISSASEFLATDPEVSVRFPALPNFLRSSGLERGPLSLVSTIEELLERKRNGSGL